MKGRNLIAPHRDATLSAIVPEMIPDKKIDAVKYRRGVGLYTWGVVEYYDTFNKRHRTTFLHNVYWDTFVDPNTGKGTEVTLGTYLPRHNYAN
jgi:hypothetical protein